MTKIKTWNLRKNGKEKQKLKNYLKGKENTPYKNNRNTNSPVIQPKHKHKPNPMRIKKKELTLS